MLEICRARRCAIDNILELGAILGMYALRDGIDGQLDCGVMLENAIGFIRPDNLAAVRPPPKTAGVAEPLCFGQVGFAALQLLSQLLLLSNIHPCPKETLKSSSLCDRNPHAAHATN